MGLKFDQASFLTTDIAAGMGGTSSLQIGLLIGGIVVLLFVIARKGRNRGDTRTSSWRASSAVHDPSIKDLGAVMTELDGLARQIHGKLDLKIATLQKIIRDADQRIDELSRLQRAADGKTVLDIQLDPESPDRAFDDRPLEPHQAVYRLADSGYTTLQIAQELARHTGEVELILSLRRAKNRSGAATQLHKQAG